MPYLNNTTVILQIGNTDNKLAQQTWSAFCMDLESLADTYFERVHFIGHSLGDAPWQNMCIVGEFPDHQTMPETTRFEDQVRALAVRFDQDSIAVTYGRTAFLGPQEKS